LVAHIAGSGHGLDDMAGQPPFQAIAIISTNRPTSNPSGGQRSEVSEGVLTCLTISSSARIDPGGRLGPRHVRSGPLRAGARAKDGMLTDVELTQHGDGETARVLGL